MEYQSTPMVPRTNTMASISLISAIVGWVSALLTSCTLLLPIIFCTVFLSCIPPLGWLTAVITGHLAKNQIKSTGEGGDGQATGGLIMGYIGLGLTALSLCIVLIIAVLTTAGVITLPILEEIMQQ